MEDAGRGPTITDGERASCLPRGPSCPSHSLCREENRGLKESLISSGSPGLIYSRGSKNGVLEKVVLARETCSVALSQAPPKGVTPPPRQGVPFFWLNSDTLAHQKMQSKILFRGLGDGPLLLQLQGVSQSPNPGPDL